MKVVKLEIRRQESYEKDAGQLKGLVTLQDDMGQQSVVLSAGAMSRLFGVIAEEVSTRARLQAGQVKQALQDAQDEPLLLEADGRLQIEG